MIVGRIEETTTVRDNYLQNLSCHATPTRWKRHSQPECCRNTRHTPATTLPSCTMRPARPQHREETHPLVSTHGPFHALDRAKTQARASKYSGKLRLLTFIFVVPVRSRVLVRFSAPRISFDLLYDIGGLAISRSRFYPLEGARWFQVRSTISLGSLT